MASITTRIDEVIQATTTLRDIRNQIAELEEARAALEAKAERILADLASAAASSLRPDAGGVSVEITAPLAIPNFWKFGSGVSSSITDRIVQYLARNPNAEYGATELAAALGMVGESNVNTIRGTLSRLTAEGRITKAGYGKYRSNMEEKKNGSPSFG
jgi:hypothetical protein